MENVNWPLSEKHGVATAVVASSNVAVTEKGGLESPSLAATSKGQLKI